MAEKDKKLTDMITVLFNDLDTITMKAEPLLSFLKQRIADYSAKRKFAQVVIQGSVGNNLYFPEVLKGGIYRVEIDMLFEQNSENMITLPVWRAEVMDGLPQIRVEVVQNESSTLLEYVKLKVVQLPENLTKSDKNVFLDFNEDDNEYYLKNGSYLNNLPSTLDEIQGGIMGEKELTGSDIMGFLDGRRPFRPFKSEQQKLDTGKEIFYFRLLMDKVASIKVKWPDFAIAWGERNRKWPIEDACKEIMHNGIHVIPKSSHNSKSSTQWKYTFAVAEQSLARMFTPMQKNCYLILKQLKRKYVSQVSVLDGSMILSSGISTHHLKTVMFWTSEKLDPCEWQAQPGKCLHLLIQTLVDFLLAKQCPNYFIPEVNLFERLWMDESKILYVKNIDDLRDLRIQGALELVLKVQENVEDYLTRELLEVVDEDHDRSESNAEFVQDSMFGSWKFELGRMLTGSPFPFGNIDYNNLCMTAQDKGEGEEEGGGEEEGKEDEGVGGEEEEGEGGGGGEEGEEEGGEEEEEEEEEEGGGGGEEGGGDQKVDEEKNQEQKDKLTNKL